MRIAIGSDHRGFATKEQIKRMLVSKGYDVEDFGTDSRVSCDYPDTAVPACRAITGGRFEVGILLCGSGIGMSISANKVRGIRAALCHDELTAEMSRRHNNANVLCLPADLVGEELTRRIVEVWLKTPFEGGRHGRRVQKIGDYEQEELGDGEHRPNVHPETKPAAGDENQAT